MGSPKLTQDELDKYLGMAVQEKSVAFAELALAAGANVNSWSKPLPLGSPLIQAIFNRDAAMVQFLIDAGADAVKGNQFAFTPVQFAEKSGDQTIIEVVTAAHDRQLKAKRHAEGVSDKGQGTRGRG